MQEAERVAQNEMFARSNRARAFARCMGDDMEKSTAGFADPFAEGAVVVDEAHQPVKRKRRKPFAEEYDDDEILSLEDIA